MNTDQESHPRQFANHVLRQIVTHLAAEDMIVTKEDYIAMRVAFRSLGGSWVEIAFGNIVHLELLKKIVTAWSQEPGRKTESDEAV